MIIVIGYYATDYLDHSCHVIFYYVTLTPRGSLIVSLVTYDPLTPSVVVTTSRKLLLRTETVKSRDVAEESNKGIVEINNGTEGSKWVDVTLDELVNYLSKYFSPYI